MAHALSQAPDPAPKRKSPILRATGEDLAKGWLIGSAELHRLFPRDDRKTPDGEPSAATPPLEVELLRDLVVEREKRLADKDIVIGELRRRLSTAEEERRTAKHVPLREAELLREMLTERDKRVTDKDAVIDQLRRQLTAAHEERQVISRQLTTLLLSRGSPARRLDRAARAVGRMLDVLGAIILSPLPTAEQRQQAEAAAKRQAAAGESAAKKPAARGAAERALLDEIARLNRTRDR